MLDTSTKTTGVNEWGLLLDETRKALSTLRAQDLDELVARADCMLAATVGQDSIRQRMPRPGEREMLDVSNGHRMLSDLLAATHRNIEVLRRQPGYDRSRAGGAISIWVR